MIRALMIKGTPEGLNFIDEDITLMRQVFDELGISNEMISGNRYDVLKKLLNIIECIDRTESIIVYYTGHGVVKNGKFQLKLEKEEKKSNYLPIEELFSTISEARNNKVAIILDCCNAGAAINEWKKDICEKHSLFLASGSIENAKEIVEFRASFFTYYIYKAIMSKQDKLLLNGKILLSKLHEVVIEYTKRYNNDNDCNMPLPELFGSRNIDFILGYGAAVDEKEKFESVIKGYLESFIYCVEKCDKGCYGEFQWCNSIFRMDVNMLKFQIPSVKEFLINTEKSIISKLDIFFENWFTKEESYLGLLGDMGVGKSSACIYLFYYLCQKYDGDRYSYVPVYLPLNIFDTQWKEEELFKIIKKYMSQKFTVENIKQLCKQRRLVFILDGFDEISGDSSIAVILKNYNSLKPFFRLNCKTILTCRTHYFSEEEHLEEVLAGKIEGTDFAATLLGSDEYPFNIIEIMEFSEDEILGLIKLLLPDKDKFIIWEKIRKIYDLRDLAKRAILLKMILRTLSELEKRKEVSNSSVLYTLYTRKLLRRELEERKIGMDISEKEKFIGYIAYLMFSNDVLLIDNKKFNLEIEKFFKESVYSRDELNNINYDCRVSTFFSRDRNDNYRFIHKSFYEYYFAQYCLLQIEEENYFSWNIRWFSREIAYFIQGLLCEKKYRYLIPKIIQISLQTNQEILIWNTLHVLSLLDVENIEKYLTNEVKAEYIKRGESEKNCIIIRQFCRIIAKFIDRKCAEKLIEKIILIARNDEKQNIENDHTYYNYYGGEKAACQAFIKHLTVDEPKYDAKLHLYLLEHLASVQYVDKIIDVTSKWNKYEEDIKSTIEEIKKRKKIS